MTTLKEGQKGFAKGSEQLTYPDVSSCLTVTCVTADGGKWGAHMSMFLMKGGQHNYVLLQDLRSQMSIAKALPNVQKVLVVGALEFWPYDLYIQNDLLKGRKMNPNGIQSNEPKTAEIILARLGLKHLRYPSHLQFKNHAGGPVLISAGRTANDVRYLGKAQKSA